ncbi:MAG: 1-acyl-sn-glycerol-3-phosphate acyltransferase [Myxococcales bacterium]|nr:1-acyl-sn-glycerol-3-phosphate acyltransferase [Myxococcales bacterium]MCB9531701.1 1-acyl-sn-glycerol-3-phosphate acyltransferase [Myxococcales bacterium]
MTPPVAGADSPLFRFNRDRGEIIDEVVERVTREALERAWRASAEGLDYLLNEAAYIEIARLEHDTDPAAAEQLRFWHEVARTMGRASEEENAERLRRVVARFAAETVGHFRPTVFKFATQLLPTGLSYALSKGVKPDPASLAALRDRLIIEGEVGKLRRLAEVGTIVFVPTHSSHLDSILVTWAIHEARLPPPVYGAETHLFTHPLMSFFMANLGAYRVNRERQHRLYRRVLKAYSQVLIERGYHGMFFPAGQRSRSNAVESSLKLGLLSTALEAYIENVLRKRDHRPVFVVPVTINYNLVLEAPTLISDHLAEDGHHRAIIRDDEFSDIRRVARFVRATLDLGLNTTVRFATPMDVFGNAVDQDGESLDNQGRRVDPERYLWINGVPAEDPERDRAYTRLLAGRVVDAFRRNTVINPLHIVCFALIEHLRRSHPSWDLPRTLRFAKGDSLAEAVAVGETERLARLARRDAQEGEYRLSRAAKTDSAAEMLDQAIAALAVLTDEPALVRSGRTLRLQDPRILYYYANRLRGFDLERRLGAAPGGYR